MGSRTGQYVGSRTAGRAVPGLPRSITVCRKKRNSRTVVCVDEQTAPDHGTANEAGRTRVRRAAGTEVTHVRPRPVPRLHVPEIAPRRRVRLYTRPHIDLLRIAGALCRP
ncbi:putative leader peptide [Streptomyces sp. NBC_00414]|uniref:putative leader peptide n=1 Tax=Streptomyces sp. NBC_00414 TaxID=2975739 RepID=UPI003FA761DE